MDAESVAIMEKLLIEIGKQLSRLNDTMEAILNGELDVRVSGGINTHSY